MSTETRTFNVTLHPEARSDGKLRLSGTAAVFNSPSEDLGFREVLEPGAFRDALLDGDPFLVWQHNIDQPLARVSAGNLTLTETSRGLEFQAELPATSLAKDAVELVKSGVIRAMSFAFSMAGGRDRWERRDGEDWRFVERIGRLFEISLVSQPAYAATSVEARQATAATRGRLKVKERSSYGIGSKHSFFRDLLVVSESKRHAHDLLDAGVQVQGLPLTGRLASPGSPPDAFSPEAAQRRLMVQADEQRAGTTSSTAGGGFIPTGAPAYVADAFSASARAVSILTTVLPNEPLPDTGMVLKTPRITTGDTVAIQATQNSALSNTDMVEEEISNPVGTIAGYVDISVQLFERSDPPIADVVLATELGRAIGAALDLQILSGTGSNGQMLGLITVTGIGTTAYADASPTQAEAFPKIAQAYGDLSIALGNTATAILMHPRRSAWFYTWKDSATGEQSPLRWPARLVETPAIPTTGGASTSEDYIVIVRAEELPVYTAAPIFEVFPQVNSATGTTRVLARQYAGSLFARRPEAIAKISGSGLAAPSYV